MDVQCQKHATTYIGFQQKSKFTSALIIRMTFLCSVWLAASSRRRWAGQWEKSLRSKLNPDLLNKLYEEAKVKAIESDLKVKSLEKKIEDCEEKRGSLAEQYDSMRSWADLYDDCDMEMKKMILSRIMSAVKVSQSYEIEIDLTVDCEELGISY